VASAAASAAAAAVQRDTMCASVCVCREEGLWGLGMAVLVMLACLGGLVLAFESPLLRQHALTDSWIAGSASVCAAAAAEAAAAAAWTAQQSCCTSCASCSHLITVQGYQQLLRQPIRGTILCPQCVCAFVVSQQRRCCDFACLVPWMHAYTAATGSVCLAVWCVTALHATMDVCVCARAFTCVCKKVR
jgi:hypothetical protein